MCPKRLDGSAGEGELEKVAQGNICNLFIGVLGEIHCLMKLYVMHPMEVANQLFLLGRIGQSQPKQVGDK